MKKEYLIVFILFFGWNTLYAVDEVKIGDLYYYLNSSTKKTASVTSPSSGKYSGDIVIPSSVTYEGITYNVIEIRYAFWDCTGLTSITIPNSVKSIISGAFYGCGGLTSIVVESGNTVYDSRENCNAIIETATNTLIRGCNTTVIPNSVTSIGAGAFSGCTGLTSVTIGKSVTSIRSSAFNNCKNLTSIVVESGNTVYDSRENCNAIIETATNALIRGCNTTVIPNSVTSIGEYAFYGCTGLTSVTIPNSVTSIENCTFSSSGLTSITIPNSVTSIGTDAFSGCTGLTSVTIGKNVTSIGQSSFSYCTGLTSVVWNAKHCDCTSRFSDAKTNMESFTFGNEVDSIPAYLCYGMSKLTSITIPKSVTWIGDCAFNGCTGLTSVVWNAKKCGWSSKPFSQSINSITSFTFGNEVDSIPAYLCYRMSKLTSITIPNSVMSIGDYAFQYCTGLTSVTIGKNVTSIGKYAFSDCTSLTTVVWNAKKCGGWGGYSSSPFYDASNKITSFTFGNEVDSIPNYLCYNMNKLTSVTIPNSVPSIGHDAFNGCTGLTSIIIPNSVTSIGYDAFNGCTGLTSITVPNSVTSIENRTFYGCTGLTSITIPSSVKSIGNYAFRGCTGLKKVNYTGDVKGWLSIDMSMSDNPIYYSRNLYINDVLLTDLVIPDRVTEVSAAFAYDTCITSVTIPNSVTTIGDSAFYRCSSLTSITIPNSVTSIGTDAFYGCTGLKKVNYTGDVKGWLSIDMSMSDNPIHYSRNLYINDVLLTDLVIPDRVTEVSAAFAYDTCITSVTIPNSVTSIGEKAFYGCTGLTSITIPNSVTSIGEYAFYGCTGLTSVTIPNSVTNIGSSAFYRCTSLTSITIPNSVTNIGSNAFCRCTSLTSITIPNSVTSIGGNAFYGCTGLTSITVPNSVTSIGEYAFYGCTGLTSITVPNSVTSIENRTFYGCTGLTSITIPNSVTSIGSSTFYGCTGLTSIRVESQTPPQCGYSCFSCCPNDIPLYIPCGTKEAYQADAVWSSFTNIIEEHEYSAIIQPSANGAVETVAYTCDNELTIQATANEHYHFTQWNDGNTDNPRTFVAFQDTTLTAEFAIDQHTISVQTEHGHIEGTGEHDYGTSITLTAIADEHYHFTQWGDGNTDNPRTVVVEGDATYAAEFAIDQFTITTTAEGNGYVSGDGTYDYGVEVILYAIADEHYHFTQWSDGNADNPRTVLVEGEATYTAEFAADPILTVVSADGNKGTVSGAGQFKPNSSCEISATANFGYHFAQWNDGNTDNPRTIVLTCDTTFTAEFALAYSGQCGDNLYWSYANHTLTISGTGAMYDYDESNLPWLLLRDTITAVVLERGITHIGNNAFNNFAKLNKIELPNTLTSIGASAFACCRKLYDIYSYAIEPPVADNSSFTNYNVYLYVLCDNLRDYQMDVVFGSFKYIKCMGADEVETINEVTVDASANDAVFTWPADGSAASYTLQITKDGEVFCTLVFNSFGQLTGIAFAPSPDGTAPANRAAESTNSGYRFTVTGLDEASTYAYDLTVKDADDKVVHNYTGTFATEGATALAPVEIAGLYATAGRIVCDGDFQIFDLLGRNVTRQNGNLNGVYVVKLGDRAQKIVVR